MTIRSLIAAGAALFAFSSVAHAQTNVPISQLPPAATPLAGSELIPCVQGGVTKVCQESATGSNLSAVTVNGPITPKSSIGIVGTTAGDNVQAGSVGEYQSVTFSSVSLTTGALTNLTSITLAAGDWDVQGFALYATSSSGPLTTVILGVSATSATLPTLGNYEQASGLNISGTNGFGVDAPIQRVNITSPTTYFLVGLGTFTNGPVLATGFIRARRVR